MNRLFLFLCWAVFSTCVPYTVKCQSFKWARGGSCSDAGGMETSPIAVDNHGNVYQTGNIMYSGGLYQSSFGTHLLNFTGYTGISPIQGVLVSTDSAGNYRWAIGVDSNASFFKSIVADPYGNVYVLGQQSGPGTIKFGTQTFSGSVWFVAKVDNLGNVVWIKDLVPGAYQVHALCINSTGRLYLTGAFLNPTFTIGATTLANADPGGGYDVFFAKFDTAGSVIWAKRFGSSGNEVVSMMTVSADSNIFVTGTLATPYTVFGSDTLRHQTMPLFVARFDKDANPLWGRIDSRDTGSYEFTSITTDRANSVYLSGAAASWFYFGPDSIAPGGSQMLLLKFDSSGHRSWARSHAYMESFNVFADACGNVWTGGRSTCHYISNPDGMFLAKFDTAGHLLDTMLLNGGGEDGMSLTGDNMGNLYVGGDYSANPFIAGSDTLTHSGVTDEAMFLLKYQYDHDHSCLPGSVTLQTQNEKTLAGSTPVIFPNPATDELNINADPGAYTALTILNPRGQQLYHQPLSASATTVAISFLPPGVYFIHFYGINTASVLKFTKY